MAFGTLQILLGSDLFDDSDFSNFWSGEKTTQQWRHLLISEMPTPVLLTWIMSCALSGSLSVSLSLSLTQKRLACVSVCPLSWWYMSVGVRNIKCWRSKGRRRHLKKYVQFLPPRPPRPPPFPCGQNLQTPSIVLASVALWYGDIISFSILLIYWVWRIVSMYDMLYNLLQCSLDGFNLNL